MVTWTAHAKGQLRHIHTYIAQDSALYAKRVSEDMVQKTIGLDPGAYGTHSLRRTKATLIYRPTRNFRAVQLLLSHTKLESTVRYLGIEVDDALEIAEQTEV